MKTQTTRITNLEDAIIFLINIILSHLKINNTSLVKYSNKSTSFFRCHYPFHFLSIHLLLCQREQELGGSTNLLHVALHCTGSNKQHGKPNSNDKHSNLGIHRQGLDRTGCNFKLDLVGWTTGNIFQLDGKSARQLKYKLLVCDDGRWILVQCQLLRTETFCLF